MGLAITNPGQSVWGLGGTGNGTGAGTTPHWWFLQCFGAPNQWRNDNGKLTRDWETDEYRAALDSSIRPAGPRPAEVAMTCATPPARGVA